MKNGWTIMRLALVLAAFVRGATWDDMAATKAINLPKGLENLAYSFVIGILIILVVAGINMAFPRGNRWSYPRWSANPFQIFNPLQFLHLISFVVVGLGMGLGVAQLVHGISSLASFFVIVSGAGMVAGVYLSTLIFIGKMSS